MKINTIELIISAVRESQYPSDKLKEVMLVKVVLLIPLLTEKTLLEHLLLPVKHKH